MSMRFTKEHNDWSQCLSVLSPQGPKHRLGSDFQMNHSLPGSQMMRLTVQFSPPAKSLHGNWFKTI
jgi:hypothetical protein